MSDWTIDGTNKARISMVRYFSAKTQETQHGRDKENTTYSTGQNSGYNIKINYRVIGK
jgi:hypothetical protein